MLILEVRSDDNFYLVFLKGKRRPEKKQEDGRGTTCIEIPSIANDRLLEEQNEAASVSGVNTRTVVKT